MEDQLQIPVIFDVIQVIRPYIPPIDLVFSCLGDIVRKIYIKKSGIEFGQRQKELREIMNISLEQALGFRVKIINVLHDTVEGKIYSYNSSSNTLTIQLPKRTQTTPSFKIIKCSFIKSLEVIGDKPSYNSFKKQQIKPSLVNIERVQELLNDMLDSTAKAAEMKRRGITKEGQYIFEALSRTVSDTRWDGKNIVVLDDIIIAAPYTIESIKSLNERNNQSLNLIHKIIERSWKELESNVKGG